jgi:hypothetical protein
VNEAQKSAVTSTVPKRLKDISFSRASPKGRNVIATFYPTALPAIDHQGLAKIQPGGLAGVAKLVRPFGPQPKHNHSKNAKGSLSHSRSNSFAHSFHCEYL